MAMALTLPMVWNWIRSQFTNSTAETTSLQMIVVLKQPSTLTFFTLSDLMCTTQSLQLMMQTSWLINASSRTRSFLPSWFSIIQFVSFWSSKIGSPLGPFWPLPANAFGAALDAAAATTADFSSSGRFLVFMSSVTFFNFFVSKLCSAPKSSPIPPPPPLPPPPAAALSLALTSSGGGAKPPFGIGGAAPLPLPLPFVGAVPAAGAASAPAPAPAPRGRASK
mmetsp:Transcript_80451/g.232413  ORF Transcript_80451/g.232413 Transcript_80451/m.232413 type:complete len:222 (+) Transcript_80451:298-963(+)